MLTGRRVLITGGTGSLGKTLVKRILTGELGRPEKITVFSRDEAKQHDMRNELSERHAATDEVVF
ncbi:MAG TPA: polysaccharide biosynthesis protein, partial [Planctomycetaceae bacterium]|nr:polysaccharide biosynthesis protein [Planctomycetaceae bacterium]